MVDLKVTLPDWDQFEEALLRNPEIIAEECETAMQQAVLLVEREVVKRTPVDQGRLRNSIAGDVKRTGEHVSGTVFSENVEHAPYVEYDTVPHFPPLKPIEDWVRRKGIGGVVRKGKLVQRPGADAVKQIARAIAFKIFHHGTEGHHMFRDGAAAAFPRVQRFFRDALQRISDRFTT